MAADLEEKMEEIVLHEESTPAKQKNEKIHKKKHNDQCEKGHPCELDPPPSYLAERIQLFEKLKAEYDAEVADKERKPIKISLPDGNQVDGTSWQTSPFEVAQSISQGLADHSVIAKVNGELWDLNRVLEADAQLELLKFYDHDGQQVFWHSSAHILGEAMERHYGGCLCYGPPIEDGFYYDSFIEERQVSSNDFKNLETIIKKAVKEKQPFERLVMTKDDLRKMFAYNKFKLRIIDEKIDTPTTTVYRCGPLIDLCRGPHVRHTGKVKSLAVTKNSATYWQGNCEAESLQRIYGISFPNEKLMKEWKLFQEEAAKRDHRKVGKEQELFFFHDISPGSCFFQPNGAHIYNTLIAFIRDEYKKRGYQEVITPNIFNVKLWQQSGHSKHYADNMFSFEVEKEQYALKPMNCPAHCLMFNQRPRSWRELPIRMADFGVLHRNELSGTLTGLTRVRRFQQDDAHIFCTLEQVESEIESVLSFLKDVYTVFGYELKLSLSTRPIKFMGDICTWNKAEKQLENSLNNFGMPWRINPEDGAFYGPKIDIEIKDALRRYHQCATIQLDFQNPENFNLTYVSGEGDEKKRPVMIHRAILGSLERQIAILTENYAGKWPFWLSPRQGIVIPVSPKFDEYAQEVKAKLYKYQVDVNLDAGETLNKKIRNAQLAHYNFILVVGEKEMDGSTVNVRTRDNKVHGEKSLADLLTRFKALTRSKADHSEDEF